MTRRYMSTRWGIEPHDDKTEFVPRTETEEARRSVRDWLRERSDDDAPEWGDESELSY